jgi:hypothetical protein
MEMSEEKMDKKDIKDTFAWAVLQLIIVPASLILLSFYLNHSISKRERMREYLKDITELASKVTENNQEKRLRDIPSLRSLARARTLTIFRESDEQSKREIVEFLVNSDLQYQFSLKRADLHNIDLSGLYLQDADLREADLRGANLTDAKLQGVDLKGAMLSDAKLSKIQYDQCTRYDNKIKSMMSDWHKMPRDPKEECHDKYRT